MTTFVTSTGGIDPHTHLAVENGVLESIDDFFSGQAAALAGGTTMHIDFVFPVRGSLTAGFEAYKKKAKNSCMDYGFHMTITKWDEVVSKEMEIMVKEKGCFSYIFCLYCTDFILHWTFVNTSLISFLSISREICLSFHVCANL